MTLKQWWDKNRMDEVQGIDFTHSGEVWRAAKTDTWTEVFQLVSDHSHLVSREFIRKLEAARERAGAGPVLEVAR